MKMKTAKRYFKDLGIATDQFVNTLFGGYPDETISAMLYRKSSSSLPCRVMMNILDFVLSPTNHDHCFQSYQSEVLRKQLPRKYRE